jgi:Ribbon-helix-helix protein, copG family
MQATLELPEAVVRQLETLARQEGATPADLIRRLVEAHVASVGPSAQRNLEVRLPLIPASETGPIQPVTGADVDAILSRDHLTA